MSNEPGAGARAAQLAALAAKAAKIAAAASAGGPYGAAAEAVKQFLPQIIKIIAITVIVLILLSILIFAGIPHFLFGWIGNNSPDILDITAKALLAKDTYSIFDTSMEDAAQGLISSVDTEGYEDVEITSDIGNTNLAWVIAIISVKYEQDLNRITPELIVDFLTDMLIVTVVDDIPILRIIVTDPGPEAVMLKHGFSDDQKQWVWILVDSMTEDQTIGADDPDYSSGVDYGDIFKTIRGLGGAAIGATQDLNDFFTLDNGDYGKGILGNVRIKIVMQMEEDEAERVQKQLSLSDEETAQIIRYKKGQGLLCSSFVRTCIGFASSMDEYNLISTDRKAIAAREGDL